MSVARRKRLEALKRRQFRGPVWRDPFPACMALWAALEAAHAATKAGREFSRLPRPEGAEPWPEAAQDAFDRLVAEFDTMHRRLTIKLPEAA